MGEDDSPSCVLSLRGSSLTSATACSDTSTASLWASCLRQATTARRRDRYELHRFICTCTNRMKTTWVSHLHGNNNENCISVGCLHLEQHYQSWLESNSKNCVLLVLLVWSGSAAFRNQMKVLRDQAADIRNYSNHHISHEGDKSADRRCSLYSHSVWD